MQEGSACQNDLLKWHNKDLLVGSYIYRSLFMDDIHVRRAVNIQFIIIY